MCTALGERCNHRPRAPLLLHLASGRFEPEIVRDTRLTRHWVKHGHTYEVPRDYWEHAQRSIARKGPIHLLAQTLKAYGIEAPGPMIWVIQGRT